MCEWQMRMDWWSIFKANKRILSGWDSTRRSLKRTCSSSDILIFASEESVDGKDNAVDDGQRSLGDSEGLSVIRSEANEFAGGAFMPELQDDDTADDEQDAADGGVEEIDSLVDWSVDNEASEDSDQDDGEANESSVDQHDRVLVWHLRHAVVVETQACQSDDQLGQLKDW